MLTYKGLNSRNTSIIRIRSIPPIPLRILIVDACFFQEKDREIFELLTVVTDTSHGIRDSSLNSSLDGKSILRE